MKKLRKIAVIKKMTSVAINAIFFLFPLIDFNKNTRVVFQF